MLSLFITRLPALVRTSWPFVPFGRRCPEHMTEPWLKEELVRRCELNPWLISEHGAWRETDRGEERETTCIANTSLDDSVWGWREKTGVEDKGESRTRERQKKVKQAQELTKFFCSFMATYILLLLFCYCSELCNELRSGKLTPICQEPSRLLLMLWLGVGRPQQLMPDLP